MQGLTEEKHGCKSDCIVQEFHKMGASLWSPESGMQFFNDSAFYREAFHLGKPFGNGEAPGERRLAHRCRSGLDDVRGDPNRELQMERVLQIQQGTRNLQVVIVDFFCIQMNASLKNIQGYNSIMSAQKAGQRMRPRDGLLPKDGGPILLLANEPGFQTI